MRIDNLIKCLPSPVVTNRTANIEVSGITHDSRAVTKDTLFIAMRGLVSDGHHYIDQSIKQGAVAVVFDRDDILIPDHVLGICVADSREALPLLAAEFYAHPEEKLRLIGITGTNGKTTSNYFLQHLLNECQIPTGRIGTTGAAFHAQEIDLVHTTPEANDLFYILSTFEKAGAETVTLEVSSHALAQKRVDGLHFSAAIFSNLTQDHLDYHANFDEYLKAKQLLFLGLGNDSLAVINTDDPRSEKIVEGCQARIIRYGTHALADYRLLEQTAIDSGLELRIKTPSDTITIRTNTIGTFNMYNLLSAFATARELGCDLQLLRKATTTLPSVPGRLEMMSNSAPFKVFVDYAHTPDAVETVLQTLSEAFPASKLISVFGCGGDRDKGKRPIMGEIATRLANFSIITDDNPRTEDSLSIINAIAVGCEDRKNFKIIQDRSSAVLDALQAAGDGDVVAILGKGHEPYQEIMGERLPYSDMNIVNQFMEQHGYSA